MTLKTSSFKINKTILKKTTLRFWPIWALYLVIMIFMMPVAVYNNMRYISVDFGSPASEQTEKLMQLFSVLDVNTTPILLAIFAIISAVAVYSYLYSARSCNMMHAFPVKRTELFATNYLAGFLFLLIPQVVIFLLTALVCGICGVPGIQYVAVWLVFVIGMSFFFYSLAVFCCMLTGHFFAGFAYYFFFNLIYVVISNLLIYLAREICYGLGSVRNGMTDVVGIFLSPLVFLASEDRVKIDCTMENFQLQSVDIAGGNLIALYCIPAVIFILLAMFLYSRRNLECAAEMTAHKFVKPMTRWMVTIVAAIGLAFWFTSVFFGASDYFLIIFCGMLVLCSWVVFFILEMAINKKFKIFKKIRFLEWGICLAAMLVVIGCMEADVTGAEKRVPVAAEVKGVIVMAGHDMVVTDVQEIEQIIAAHQEIVDSKNEYEFVDSKQYVEFEYILNDGKSFARSYEIPVDSVYMQDANRAAAIIRNLQEETDSYLKSWLVVNYEDLEMLGGTFYKYYETEVGEETIVIQKEQMEVLYEAILKDIEENNITCNLGSEYDEQFADFEYYNCHINFSMESKEAPIELYDLKRSLRDEEVYNASTYTIAETAQYVYDESNTGAYIVEGWFDVYSTCEHTVNALLELELIDDVSEIAAKVDEKYYR